MNRQSQVGTYVVESDYIAESPHELTIQKGDVIRDAVKSADGWLQGGCRGKTGHFPEDFVKQLSEPRDKTLAVGSNGNKIDTLQKQLSTPFQTDTLFQVKGVYTYLPIHDDELSIRPNDIINVTRLVKEGWYEGVLDGKQGLFPSNRVARFQDDKNLTDKQELFNKNTPIKARALYDYKKQFADELTITRGDIVTILEKNLIDEGWWKGELNGQIGVFPDNYVEEILPLPDIKYRPNILEVESKHSSQTLTKTKSIEPQDTKPSSATLKNEFGLSKTTHSLDETNHAQSADVKDDHKVHTPSSQREVGPLESPRYTNRSFVLSNTNNSTLNDTAELKTNIPTTKQLQEDLLKLKSSVDEMKLKFTDQIRDLIHELDDEKKARAVLQIELERLQKSIQKSSFTN